MKINGKNTYSVPFDTSHLDNPKYFEWVNDIEVMKYIGRAEYLKPIEFEKVREYVEGLWKNKYCHFFALYNLIDDEFVGTTKINYIDDAGLATSTADIGIMIGDREYWGKGLATDAIYSISKYAFDVLGVRKLTAGAISENIGVIKAFTNNGYKQEANLRKKLLISGVYMDHVLLGCFNDELIESHL
jgi:[ribosomal protein S5]-alanine N-acetyltransferase